MVWKKRKWMSLGLALLMTLGMTPPAAAAGTAAADETLQWSVPSDGGLPDSDALLSGYLQSQVNKELYGDAALFGTAAGDRLEEGSLEKAVILSSRSRLPTWLPASGIPRPFPSIRTACPG